MSFHKIRPLAVGTLLLGLLGHAAGASPAPTGHTITTAPTLSPDELVRVVLAHNSTLLAARHVRAQAQAGIISASALPNPRLEFGNGQLHPAAVAAAGGAVTTWGLSQFIENPTLRKARIEAAELGLHGSDAQFAQSRSETVAQVLLRAYELLLRIEELRMAGEELELLEKTRDRVLVRVNSGEAARYEIIKAEAEFISARQRQQSAQLAMEQARLRLNQLASGQLPAQWTLQASLDKMPATAPVGRLRDQLLEGNPELQVLRAETRRLLARLRESEAGRWPGVELRYTGTREPENRQGMIGASVQIPLLDQRRGPQAEAQAELLRARTHLDGRQTELLLQLDAAVLTQEMARLRVEALGRGAVRDAEAAVRVAEAAYRYGERGILDVLDAQRVLRAVRADLLQARFQLQATAIEIDLLTGRYAIQP